MEEKIINIFEKIKAGNKKIDSLWQSKGIEAKKSLYMSLGYFGFFFLLWSILSIFQSSNLLSIIFRYLQLAYFWLIVFCIIFFFYAYKSKPKIKKQIEKIIKLVFKLYLILTLIIISPIIILIAIINTAIKFNAKTVDNFQDWLILLSINITFIVLTMNINIHLTSCITNHFQGILLYKYRIQISVPTVIICY